MSDDQEHSEKRGFKVEDRRRFSESGDARDVQQEPPQSAPAADPPPASTAAAGRAASAVPPLAMSFSTLVISLSTQALAHLGEIPNPIDSQVSVDLVGAKQMVDILAVLQDKTRGNLDAAESTLLENILYELRLKYVEHARGRS